MTLNEIVIGETYVVNESNPDIRRYHGRTVLVDDTDPRDSLSVIVALGFGEGLAFFAPSELSPLPPPTGDSTP